MWAVLISFTAVTAAVFGPSGECRLREPPTSGLGVVPQTRDEATVFQGPFIPSLQDTATQADLPVLALLPDRRLRLLYRAEAYGPDGRWALIHLTSPDLGFTWPGSPRWIHDVHHFYLGNQALVVSRDRTGVAWIVVDSSGVDQVRFTQLSQDGYAARPSVRIDDGTPVVIQSKVEISHLDEALLTAWYTTSTTGDPWIAYSRSIDGGRTWQVPTGRLDASIPPDPYHGPTLASDHTRWFYVLAGNYESMTMYRTDATATEWTQAGTPTADSLHLPRSPSIAVAADGTLGAAFSASLDAGGGPPSAIWFSTSADFGETWSVPVEVSREGVDGNHYEPHLASDPLGGWHIAWVHNMPWQMEIDAYYSVLRSGESSWPAPVRVNFEPATVDVLTDHTLSIVADDDGYVYIAWANTPNLWNPDHIYVATTRPRPYDAWEGMDWYRVQVAPHPARGVATLRIPVPGDALISVQLFDTQGRAARSWAEIRAPRGVQTLTWDGRLRDGSRAPSGVYLWCVGTRSSNRSSTATGKLVYLR